METKKEVSKRGPLLTPRPLAGVPVHLWSRPADFGCSYCISGISTPFLQLHAAQHKHYCTTRQDVDLLLNYALLRLMLYSSNHYINAHFTHHTAASDRGKGSEE